MQNVNDNRYQILGIGTPIIDYLVNVSDEYINKLPGVPGGSILIDYPTFKKIIKDHPLSRQRMIAGGSSANTIKGLAQLKHSCSLIGRIGKDHAGSQFTQNMISFGIKPHLTFSDLPTAQVACLITPDHDRTMRAYIGAGAEMSANDLTPDLFEGIHLVHIEGYLMNRIGFVEKAMSLAKAQGAKISFDLSSFEIVEAYQPKLLELLSQYVDIVFANEEEANVLTGFTPEKACKALKDLCEIAVIKMGEKGSIAANSAEIVSSPAYQVQVVDTTGAGDLFASGFLHGYLTDQPLRESLRYGSLIASHVITRFGAEIPLDDWKSILKEMRSKED